VFFPIYTFDNNPDYGQHRLDALEQIAAANSSDVALSELVFNVPPAYADSLFSLCDARAGGTLVVGRDPGAVQQTKRARI